MSEQLSGETGQQTPNANGAASNAPAGNEQGAAPQGGDAGSAKKDEQAKAGESGKEQGAQGAKDSGGAPEGAPEKYEDFKLPEGVALDTEVMAGFQATAKALRLSQGDAQKLVDIGGAIVKRQLDQIAAVRSQWNEALSADKEIGGKDLEANKAVAMRGLEAYATPELKEFLRSTGITEHPEMVRLFVKLGKSVSEDNGQKAGEGGGAKGQRPRELKDRLYGTK